MILLNEYETKTGGRLDAIDVTDEVLATLEASGVRDGNVLVFSPHTTCCIYLGPPGKETSEAIGRLIEAIAPADAYYAHDDLEIRTENLIEDGDEPANAPAHIFQVVAGKSSESIPVSEGALLLGERQRVLFVELCSSRLRRYCIQVLGE